MSVLLFKFMFDLRPFWKWFIKPNKMLFVSHVCFFSLKDTSNQHVREQFFLRFALHWWLQWVSNCILAFHRLYGLQVFHHSAILHRHPGPGLPAVAAATVFSDHQPFRHLHLQRGCFWINFWLGGHFLLLWILHSCLLAHDSGGLCVPYCFSWRDFASHFDMCWTLPGCSLPGHLPGTETDQWGQDQEHQYWVCLAAFLCMAWCNCLLLPWFSSSCIFVLVNHLFSDCVFLQPLCSVCSDSPRAGENRRAQGAGWQVKEESFLHHHSYCFCSGGLFSGNDFWPVCEKLKSSGWGWQMFGPDMCTVVWFSFPFGFTTAVSAKSKRSSV